RLALVPFGRYIRAISHAGLGLPFSAGRLLSCRSVVRTGRAFRWLTGGPQGLPAGSRVRGGNNRRLPVALPDYSMRQLLEAGVHFGHQSHRWNPKMRDYIFGARNNIHIIDLAQTVPLLHRALEAVSDTVAKGGRILFVGTKRQAQEAISQAAKKSAQY